MITYRNATLEDVRPIIDIYNSTIPSRMVTADLEPVSVKSKMDWFLNHSPAYRPIWIFEEGEKMLGWLSFQPFHERAAYDHTAEISIYLAEEARGKGVGSYMLECAIHSAPGLDIQHLVCLVFGHNEPSLNLMKKFGFEIWGRLPEVAELDGVKRDLIILGRKVGSSADQQG